MLDGMNLQRRTLMAHIGLLLGSAAIPAEAFAAPKKKAKGKPAAKKFFSPSQMALVTALADTLIPATDTPGAVATKAPQLLDSLMVNWASPTTQQLILGALPGIEKMALDADKKPFAALTPARRKELLIPYDKAALKPVPRKDKLTGLAAIFAGPSFADPGYGKLKDLIINLYYTSEVAMTQEVIYEHVPGPFVPSLKITPQTRPFAGVGGLG
ncbi:gluconate 2-dehydrogenase subunit 3 family protein [Novosphingobium sp. MW5]|nr:gluconate 2-dehydrogenase subunit 3 family protein [Novosphingobium sp. MW5]